MQIFAVGASGDAQTTGMFWNDELLLDALGEPFGVDMLFGGSALSHVDGEEGLVAIPNESVTANENAHGW